jgi:hypothetical protein
MAWVGSTIAKAAVKKAGNKTGGKKTAADLMAEKKAKEKPMAGKFIEKKINSKNPYVASVAKEMKVNLATSKMTKKELNAVTGQVEKHYAEMELERRAKNKSLKKDLKSKVSSGALSQKKADNRLKANRSKPMSAQTGRESIQKEMDR